MREQTEEEKLRNQIEDKLIKDYLSGLNTKGLKRFHDNINKVQKHIKDKRKREYLEIYKILNK
tara:strand:- start:61 stop:249 length:189 start_codon:yes stop_codon:yes gene_type:complete